MCQVSQRNENLVQKLQRVPDGFKISDFDNCVLPVIAAMVAYHPIMDRSRQVSVFIHVQWSTNKTSLLGPQKKNPLYQNFVIKKLLLIKSFDEIWRSEKNGQR